MNRRRFINSSIVLTSAGMGCLTQESAAGMDLCAEEREPVAASGGVRLRGAENPYGPPPSAIQAVQAELVSGNRYPRPAITALREKIAKDTGLTADHVAIGAGSIELILNTAVAYGAPGRAILSGAPTWNTMMEHAQRQGADWIRVPLTKSYHYDFERMLGAITDKVDMVYLCHPNNPPGIAENHDELEAFVKEAAKTKLVMIDEAFIDCLDNAEQLSMKKLVPDHDNVIVVRTFSKLWGMAGFRVGYLLGHPKVVTKLKSTVPTLEMQSRFGVVGAMSAYDDHAFIEMSRQKMREAQKIVYDILERRSLQYIRSDCNFISFQVPESNLAFAKKLETQHGVAIKSVSLGDDKNWCRVSCGLPAELAVFDDALGKVL